MKKEILLFFLIILGFSSCEKDDICIEKTTPNLVLRLYDNDNLETVKPTSNMYIWVASKDTLPSYNKVNLDSIAIPLDLNNDQTTYIFENNSIKDTIVLGYTRNDIFVSRSCGYKTLFENLYIEKVSNNWIKNFSIENQTVDNDTIAHIYLYH